jgi:photosystem II stability/assembly factor-like uncharacterized protein
VGLVCAVFFIILSVSGVLLMHYDSFGFNNVVVSGNFLPDKYFQLAAHKRSIQAINATTNGVLFIGTDYGLYRSRDAGKTWTQLEQGMFNQNIHVLAIDPKDNDVLYAGTSGGIFKTEDGGDHWNDWFDAASGLTNSEVNDLVIHPTGSEILFAATEGGLFISEDAGESWELMFGGEGLAKEMPVKLVRLSSVNSRDIYIASENGMYRSNHEEKRWTPVWASQVSNVLSMVSLKTDPEFFYIGTSKGLFKSFNRGRNWVKDKVLTAVPSLLVNPKDITSLTLTTGKKIFVSQDGGDTWKPVKTHPTHASSSGLSINLIFQIQAPSPVLLAGTTSGLFLSRDGDDHWEEAELSNSVKNTSSNVREMDLVKLITEIHTGRFFGNYFMLLVDLATLGLIVLVISGIRLGLNRNNKKRLKKSASASEDKEEILINVQETTEDLYNESTEIHDMIEHISTHLEKCKSIYMTKEKKEIEEIDRHITILDKKMHQLIRRIGEFEKYTEN